MSMDAVRKTQETISMNPTGTQEGIKKTRDKYLNGIIDNVFEKMANFKATHGNAHPKELLDPDTFVDELLPKLVDEWEILSDDNKKALRFRFKVRMVANIEKSKGDKGIQDVQNLDFETKRRLVDKYDMRMRGAVEYLATHDMTLEEYFAKDEDGKPLNVTRDEQKKAEYMAAKKIYDSFADVDKESLTKKQKSVYETAKEVVEKYNMLQAIANDKTAGEIDELFNDENINNLYEYQYEYLEKKANKNPYETKLFESLSMVKKILGTLKNVTFGNEENDTETSYMQNLGISLENLGNEKARLELKNALINDLKDLSDEEKLAKMQEILASSHDLVEIMTVVDTLSEISNPKGPHKGEPIISSKMVTDASEAALKSLFPAMAVANRMTDDGQIYLGERVADSIKNGKFEDENIAEITKTWVSTLSEPAQGKVGIELIKTGNQVVIDNTGEMISLLADDPAKSVYQFVLTDNEYLNNEQRMHIVGDVQHYCSADGYAHPDRLADLNNIATQCGYNYETGECLYSGNSTYNSNESPFSFNGYDYYTSDPDYQAYMAAAQPFGDYSSNNAFATNPISGGYENLLSNLLFGDSSDKEIIKQISESSNSQERKALIEQLSESAFSYLIRYKPDIIKDLDGRLYDYALRELKSAKVVDVTIQTVLTEIEKEQGQV